MQTLYPINHGFNFFPPQNRSSQKKIINFPSRFLVNRTNTGKWTFFFLYFTSLFAWEFSSHTAFSTTEGSLKLYLEQFFCTNFLTSGRRIFAVLWTLCCHLLSSLSNHTIETFIYFPLFFLRFKFNKVFFFFSLIDR